MEELSGWWWSWLHFDTHYHWPISYKLVNNSELRTQTNLNVYLYALGSRPALLNKAYRCCWEMRKHFFHIVNLLDKHLNSSNGTFTQNALETIVNTYDNYLILISVTKCKFISGIKNVFNNGMNGLYCPCELLCACLKRVPFSNREL